jgi:hypothetical protein
MVLKTMVKQGEGNETLVQIGAWLCCHRHDRRIGAGQGAAEQVAEKLKADGWSEIVISPNGRYLKVSGLVNGQAGQLAVDSQTGRLKADADDDDDDDD